MIPEDTTLGEGSVGLANDIELHAERIRRERSKRRQQQQLTAPVTATPEMPLVGNLIGEDHVNYVLMYNMLTGIRIGVCFTLTMVNIV
jgi:1-phosphatidylinositol-4-phosphate 5-kinase